ncbi:MAG: DUF624 domain-containing protein [Oscillospiraceae bacterium]|nr:DUF624 domain-containing protein [Oscillospiraceae bacterium]
MAKKREFGEGPLYTITNIVFWFVMCNLYVIVCILPFVLYVILTLMTDDPLQSFKDTALILYLLSLFIGPALAACYSTMGKFIRENDLNVTKDYFKYYKINFKQSFIIWGLQMTFDFLIYINLSFYSQLAIGVYIRPVIITIGVLFNALALVSLPILSRFYFSIKDLLKCAFYYGVKRFYVTISVIALFIIAVFALAYISQLILCIFSIFSYLVMMLFRPIVSDIEKNIKKA